MTVESSNLEGWGEVGEVALQTGTLVISTQHVPSSYGGTLNARDRCTIFRSPFDARALLSSGIRFHLRYDCETPMAVFLHMLPGLHVNTLLPRDPKRTYWSNA